MLETLCEHGGKLSGSWRCWRASPRARRPAHRCPRVARNLIPTLVFPSSIDVAAPVIYKLQMVEVRQTPVFRAWLETLTDRRAVERIAQRIVRLQAGLMGDVKSVGGRVSELRIDHGPG